MGRLLPRETFPSIADGVDGIETADSITGDAHKLFNVPYDCGLFFSRHADISVDVFQNPGAPYLASDGDDGDGIISPLNMGIENSRRFRALPLYASLRTYGRNFYTNMIQRQVATAQRIARWISISPLYQLLPNDLKKHMGNYDTMNPVFIIVLFKAKDAELNENLVERINSSGSIYVSGTVWQGTKAARIAIANWKVEYERESVAVIEVLQRLGLSTLTHGKILTLLETGTGLSDGS
jgi:glutamate/tyrosine decarboxylase-like PLP-dependent enzyme